MSISLWEAVGYIETLKGYSKPLLLNCRLVDDSAHNQEGATPARALTAQEQKIESEDVNSQPFVVKALGCPEISEEILFRELFGNLLARHFGIITPEPAIVALSDHFVADTQLRLTANDRIKLGSGLAVGAKKLEELATIGADWKLPSHLLQQAAHLYAFDLLVQNPDRRLTTGNPNSPYKDPNCAIFKDQLLAYDFGDAFGRQCLPGQPKSWQFSQSTFISKNFLNESLMEQPVNWEPFIEALKNLSAPLLNEMIQGCPAKWLADKERVFAYLLETRDEAEEFLKELQLSLRGSS